MTPANVQLKRACFDGDMEEARRLLDLGADPNATDEHGSGTLLTFHPPMIELLLSHGANPNVQTNENGASVLAGLACVNKLECVRVLLRAGADPTADATPPERLRYTMRLPETIQTEAL